LFGGTDYDKNKDGCKRVNHGYAVQLEDDFPAGTAEPRLEFAACSGSQLVDMVYGQQQMGKLSDTTK
jgi:hypothetical protein